MRSRSAEGRALREERGWYLQELLGLGVRLRLAVCGAVPLVGLGGLVRSSTCDQLVRELSLVRGVLDL